LGKAQWDHGILNIPGGKKIYLEKDSERKQRGREKVLIIYTTGANTSDKCNVSKRKILYSSTVWENTVTEKYEEAIYKAGGGGK